MGVEVHIGRLREEVEKGGTSFVLICEKLVVDSIVFKGVLFLERFVLIGSRGINIPYSTEFFAIRESMRET